MINAFRLFKADAFLSTDLCINGINTVFEEGVC